MIVYWGIFYAFMVFIIGIAAMPQNSELITPFGVFFASFHVMVFALLMNWFMKIDAKDKE